MQMEEKKEVNRPLRFVLTGLTVLFIALIGISVFRSDSVSGVQSVAKSVLMPMQEGLNKTGSAIVDVVTNVESLRKAQKENEELKEQVMQLQQEISLMQQDKYEIDEYRELFDLSNQYEDYEMTGANVIAKDSGNWFHSFIIDKGTNDGLAVDMAVLAQGGLAGIITSVGPSSARVMSIIDDDSNITAMSMSTKERCMVSGDLELYEDGRLRIMYVEKDASISEGDKIVTSNISTKYLPGLMVGYVDSIETDANNMTKSGTIIPYVDFSHLDTVLVITTLKNNGDDIEK
ncbi:MAG: rod shape-determining protein MreC [Lachnospiraceae bacterium]|nr:rod shape-determining protein MreC [Lachnospiraceae bacterium]MDY4970282.1 rod shape-determining protein MreC [Lachnospiraceae bacterium]